jgi:protein-S-isoprenylcysteine O-methyltransferase Ste14
VLIVLRTAVYFLIVPGIFTAFIPWWMSRWRLEPPLLGFAPFRVIGVLLMAVGVPVLLECYWRFMFIGNGTPAAMFPTHRLVVTGFYRYVRNPMYVAALSVTLGQGLFLGNVKVLAYCLFPLLMLVLVVAADEEPTLRRLFGAEYEAYCVRVPRWVPRLRPWREGLD